MLSRGIVRTFRSLHNGKGRPWRALEQRTFSSLLPLRPAFEKHPIAPVSRQHSSPLRPLQTLILSYASVRLASTSSSPTPLSSNTILASPANTTTVSPNDTFLPDDPLLSNDALVPPLQEHIGFLHELGLDYGYGPASTIQWLLEHVYVYSGMNWGPSIMVTALIVRICLVKFFYNAADMGGKVNILTPQLKPIQQRMTEAKRLGDQTAQMEAMQEIRTLYKGSGVKFSRMFLPLMFQIPIGFGTFRLLNGMSSLPVPGLETQPFLWLQDLTMSDPYLILPMATSAAFYFSFKFGGELGTTQAANQSMRIIMQYVLPAVSGLFMLFWPSAMQISFFTSSMFSLTQAYLFRQPGVRKWLRMSPLRPPIKPAPTGSINLFSPTSSATATPGKLGVVGGAYTEIKGAVNQLRVDARRKMNEQDGLGEHSRLTRRELKDAQAYERRRKLELEMEAERQKRLRRR